MVSFEELTAYKLLMAAKEYIETISLRYKGNEEVLDFLWKNANILQLKAEGILPLEDSKKGKFRRTSIVGFEDDFDRDEMVKSLEKLKDQIRADDWLFFKAILVEDSHEEGPIMSLAQSISPENIYLFFFCNGFVEECPSDGFFKMAAQFRLGPDNKALYEYFSMLKLRSYLKDNFFAPAGYKILSLVDRIAFTGTGRLFLLLHLVNTTYPDLVLDVIQRLKNKKKSEEKFFNLLEGIIFFKTNKFELAATKLKLAEIESQPFVDYERLEYTDMLANSYAQSGNVGMAILTWKSIVDDEETMTYGSSVYNDVVLNLCRYYLSINQVREARKTLYDLPDYFKEILIAANGSSYYSLAGDILYAERRFDQALENYRKAFGIIPSVMLSAKIQWLEKSL